MPQTCFRSLGYIGFRFTLDLFSFFIDDAMRKLLVDYGFGEGIVAARDALAAFIGLPKSGIDVS